MLPNRNQQFPPNLSSSLIWFLTLLLTPSIGLAQNKRPVKNASLNIHASTSSWQSLHPDEAPPLSSREGAPLMLGQGEQRILYFPGLLKYSIGSPVVRVIWLSRALKSEGRSMNEAGAARPKDKLLIKGIQTGLTDLWVWKEDGSTEHRSIRVEKLSLKDRNLALERALEKLQETEVLALGNKTVLRGEIQSLTESSKVRTLQDGFPEQIHNETTLAPSLLEEGESRLRQWMQQSSLSSDLRVERTGDTLWVRGHLKTPTESSSVMRQVRALFPMALIEIDTLPDYAPTIHFRVFLLELKRNFFRTFGLSWSPMTSAAFQVTTGGFRDLLQIDTALHQLEGSGNAKILSNPELVVRAPGEAELFAGGEIPIETHSRYTSQVTWRKHGLILRLKVTHTAGNRIRLDIYTEVSHLDSSSGGEKLPRFHANQMKTQVDAQLGSPLFLSGLLQQGVRQEAKGLPFLRSIPILGPLFGSEDYLNERSELVAILVPQAPPPNTPERVLNLIPRGPLPPPKSWLSPSDIRRMQTDPDYPWNAFGNAEGNLMENTHP
jgi:hypothetical protein